MCLTEVEKLTEILSIDDLPVKKYLLSIFIVDEIKEDTDGETIDNIINSLLLCYSIRGYLNGTI